MAPLRLSNRVQRGDPEVSADVGLQLSQVLMRHNELILWIPIIWKLTPKKFKILSLGIEERLCSGVAYIDAHFMCGEPEDPR